jgi:hypothetical protein
MGCLEAVGSDTASAFTDGGIGVVICSLLIIICPVCHPEQALDPLSPPWSKPILNMIV